MYNLDRKNKILTINSGNCIYKREIKSPRDTIKYRILAARALLSLNENASFHIYHLVPLDQHEAAMIYKKSLNGKTFSDVNFYKSYFSDIYKKLYEYYPKLCKYDNILQDRSRSFVKLYAHFDTFFKNTLGKNPLYLGMAIALQIRIIQQFGKIFPIDLIKSIFDNPIFNEEPQKIPLLPSVSKSYHSFDHSFDKSNENDTLHSTEHFSEHSNEQVNEQVNEQSNEMDMIRESDSLTARSCNDILPVIDFQDPSRIQNQIQNQNQNQMSNLTETYQPDLTTQMVNWIQNIDSRLKSVEIILELLRMEKK